MNACKSFIFIFFILSFVFAASEKSSSAQPTVVDAVKYHQISHFATEMTITSMKISADGTRIVFGTGGPGVKVFTINSDGSGLTQIFDYNKTGFGPFVDICADGSKVIWCDYAGDGEIYIANAGGGMIEKIVTLLPNPDPNFAPVKPNIPLPPRMTADASQVFFIHNHRDPKGTGVWRVNAGGSGLTQLFSYYTMAQRVFSKDVSEYTYLGFTDGFDISGNGSRMIVGTNNWKVEAGDLNRGDAIVVDGNEFYHIGEYATGNQPFSTNKDGNQFLMFKRENNPTLGADEINVYFVPIGTGSPIKVISGLDIFGISSMTQLSGNSSSAIIAGSNGRLPITLVDRITASRLDLVSIDGISIAALGGFRFSSSSLPSITWNGTRFCFLAFSNPSQIWIGEINLDSVPGEPSITHVSFNPDYVLIDGSTTCTFQAHVNSAPDAIHTVTFEPFRDGAPQFRALSAAWPYNGFLVDNGEFGDLQAGDGYFQNNSVRADLPETPLGSYTIRLAAINSSLEDITMVDVESFSILAQPSSIREPATGLSSFLLYQNYPNPFNASTRINFYLSRDGHVSIKIFDILGNEMVTILDEFTKAGHHSVSFDAKQIPSGVYFYKIKSGNFKDIKKMLIIR